MDWADNLWPYINGKALVSGIKLGDMDAADMLDVIHFFFEEDTLRYQSGEQAEAASKFRTSFYRLYDVDYKFAISGSSSGGGYANGGGRKYVSSDAGFDFEDDIPGATNQAVKPYFPATQFDPDTGFASGGVLDGPLG